MSDNHIPPKPEDMGDHLDEEIKETVHDWANNPEGTDYDDLDEKIDQKLRRTVAGWVGAPEDADWKTIGEKMDAKTRHAIGKWVGAEEDADWLQITARIDNRVRYNIARLVRAPREEGEARWSDIGAKVERDMRGWMASLVGTEKDADWQAIGDRLMDQVRQAFDKITKSEQKGDAEGGAVRSTRIEIESDEPPAVQSEKPIDPEG